MKKSKLTESSGNIFLDIGFSEEEAEYHQLRVDLAFAIHRLLEELKANTGKSRGTLWDSIGVMCLA